MKNKTEFKYRGFTLVEMMIVIAVLAVLVVLGIPQLTKVISGRNLVGQATDVASALAFARAEAVTRSQQVVMCSSDDRQNCQVDNNWSDGWIIFLDADNGSDLDAGEQILKTEGEMNTRVTLNANSSLVVFNLAGETTAAANVVFHLCSTDQDTTDTNRSRLITVNRVGSANMSIGTATCN